MDLLWIVAAVVIALVLVLLIFVGLCVFGMEDYPHIGAADEPSPPQQR